MIALMIGIATFAHVILPFLLLYWLAYNRGTSRAYKLMVVLLVASFVVPIWPAGAWGIFGRWWPYIFIVLFVPALWRSARALKELPWLPPKRWQAWVQFSLITAIAVSLAVGMPEAVPPRTFTDTPLALEFPLQSGTYYIAHGGASETFNHHYVVPAKSSASISQN